MYSGFFDVLRNSSNKSVPIFEICIEIRLVDYRTGLRLDAGLLVRQGKLVQDVDVGEGVR